MPLHANDYVSPNFEVIDVDFAFPNLANGPPETAPWGSAYEVGVASGRSHAWYCHSSLVPCGYSNRDEVLLMYNVAKTFSSGAGLEIGCYFGWSTAHLARNFERFDVVDPILSSPSLPEIEASLSAAGVRERCKLHGGLSPEIPVQIGREHGPLWSFALVDGDHALPAPLADTAGVEPFMLADAAIVFHDLYCPPVGEALNYLKWRGWKTRACQTANGVGIAWRGSIQLPVHIPDPRVQWKMPERLLMHSD
jgi:predicted O-methyltransferase YrrM